MLADMLCLKLLTFLLWYARGFPRGFSSANRWLLSRLIIFRILYLTGLFPSVFITIIFITFSSFKLLKLFVFILVKFFSCIFLNWFSILLLLIFLILLLFGLISWLFILDWTIIFRLYISLLFYWSLNLWFIIRFFQSNYILLFLFLILSIIWRLWLWNANFLWFLLKYFFLFKCLLVFSTLGKESCHNILRFLLFFFRLRLFFSRLFHSFFLSLRILFNFLRLSRFDHLFFLLLHSLYLLHTNFRKIIIQVVEQCLVLHELNLQVVIGLIMIAYEIINGFN